MQELINYRTIEAEPFLSKPHILISPSEDFPNRWAVSVCWREDIGTSRIDAEYPIFNKLIYETAIFDANSFSKSLNLPVIQYYDDHMSVTFIEPVDPCPDWKENLQLIMECPKVRRFQTH